MLNKLLGELSPAALSIICFPLVIILVYMSYQLFLARRKRYLSLTINAVVLSAFEFLSLVTYSTNQNAVGDLLQNLSIIAMFSFMVLLTQVQWEQKTSEKIISYILLAFYGLMSIAHLSAIANMFIVGLSGYLLYQIKGNYKATLKTSIVLVIVIVHSLASIGANLMKSEILWTFANILVPIFLVTLTMSLQDRLMNLLMNSYYASVTDPLTGLYNKRHYHKQLAAKMNKSGAEVYAIFCDIDNFKKLNDTQGHKKGDEILIRVGSIIQEEVNEHGIAARFGGEEIVAFVNLPSEGPPIENIAEVIRSRVESETIVTLSIGFAKSNPSLTVEELIHMADKAMYYSKESGKNRWTAFNKSIQNNEQEFIS
ncbi:GGDEF domain-containing protein [Paenibacillus sp. Y412MC10]|uniref:GGDEF domain-containing protein n=1 Tax=Geobacillus sp. (strain Y412MC10) TaxID=481743 RepID=UPI0011AB31BC|nr:GGDEF domain-containing protein [Paenibacillus sp. Y412MC10]